MANKPVWFLDVDGVINVVSKIGNEHYSRFPRWEEVEVAGYKIRYSPDLVEFINNISARVDVRMLTTWKNASVELLAPAIGLKNFPVEDSVGTWSANGSFNGGHHLPENRWWKLNCILNHIETRKSDFIWSDDDLYPQVRNYARRMADFEGLETCLITPHLTLGLEPVHLERIEKFVAAIEKYYPAGETA